MTDAERLRDLARGELEVAKARLDEGDVAAYRAHLEESIRIEVLARREDGELSPLTCGTALLMAETWNGSVDGLIEAARQNTPKF